MQLRYVGICSCVYAGICESRTTRRTSSSSGSSTRSMMPYSTAGKQAAWHWSAWYWQSSEVNSMLRRPPDQALNARAPQHIHNAWRRPACSRPVPCIARSLLDCNCKAARTRFVRVEVLWPRNVLCNLLLAVACVLGQQPHLRAGSAGEAGGGRCCGRTGQMRWHLVRKGKRCSTSSSAFILTPGMGPRRQAAPVCMPTTALVTTCRVPGHRPPAAPASTICPSPLQRWSCAAPCGRCLCRRPGESGGQCTLRKAT